MGGGIAVGTIVLVEEDTPTSFYLNLLKYFVGEGLAIDHEVAVCSFLTDFDRIIKQLPTNLTIQQQEFDSKDQEKQIQEDKDKNSVSKSTYCNKLLTFNTTRHQT